MITPTPGRIVSYTLTEQDAASINKRRADAAAVTIVGTTASSGNHVYEGESYPMVIVRVWGAVPSPENLVNGQVLLDGNDTCWVTSRRQNEDSDDLRGTWREYPRV